MGCLGRIIVLCALLMNAVATGLTVLLPLADGKQLGDAAIIHIDDLWTMVIASAIAFVGNALLALVLWRRSRVRRRERRTREARLAGMSEGGVG